MFHIVHTGIRRHLGRGYSTIMGSLFLRLADYTVIAVRPILLRLPHHTPLDLLPTIPSAAGPRLGRKRRIHKLHARQLLLDGYVGRSGLWGRPVLVQRVNRREGSVAGRR